MLRSFAFCVRVDASPASIGARMFNSLGHPWSIVSLPPMSGPRFAANVWKVGAPEPIGHDARVTRGALARHEAGRATVTLSRSTGSRFGSESCSCSTAFRFTHRRSSARWGRPISVRMARLPAGVLASPASSWVIPPSHAGKSSKTGRSVGSLSRGPPGDSMLNPDS